MKKSILKKLTKMARDGDPEAIEALAEAVEEIIDPESTEAVIATVAEPDPAPVSAPAPAAEVVEGSPAVDDEPLTAVLERLDRIISLLTASAPAADEDPAEGLPEELAEVVGEAVEAVAEGEAPAEETAQEVAAIVEEVIGEAGEPSAVLEPDAENEVPDPEPFPSADALRAALNAVRPALKRMSQHDRKRVCADIAARLRRKSADRNHLLATLKDARPRSAAPSEADLGRQIMAKRNPNYKA